MDTVVFGSLTQLTHAIENAMNFIIELFNHIYEPFKLRVFKNDHGFLSNK
jgi:hypothetical protein